MSNVGDKFPYITQKDVLKMAETVVITLDSTQANWLFRTLVDADLEESDRFIAEQVLDVLTEFVSG